MIGTNGVKTLFLIVLLSGLLLIAGMLMGGYVGLVIAAVIAFAMNFFAYWKSDSAVLTMMHAREVSASDAPQLHRIVERAAHEARLPKPKVYIVQNPAPNAFATGRSPNHAAVAATTGIMGLLTERELAGVFAHELAHVKNRDTLINTVVAMIATAILLIAMVARFGLLFGFMFAGGGRDARGGGEIGQLAGMLALAIIAPIVATLIKLAISRAREFSADATGARNSQDPEALASALTKLQLANQRVQQMRPAAASTTNAAVEHLFIINPFAGRMGRWFSSHPPTEQRVERLRAIGREMGQLF